MRTGVFVQTQKMKTTRISWAGAMFKVLLIAALPVHVWTYKILIINWIGKSHVFSMAAVAEDLVNRGHKVTFFLGENFQVNLPELGNGSEFSVIRYRDATDGAHMDYDALAEECTRSATESTGNTYQVLAILNKVYVNFT